MRFQYGASRRHIPTRSSSSRHRASWYTPPARFTLRWLLRGLNARMIERLRLMDYIRFFLTAREAESLAVNCASYGAEMTRQIIWWSALRYTRIVAGSGSSAAWCGFIPPDPVDDAGPVPARWSQRRTGVRHIRAPCELSGACPSSAWQWVSTIWPRSPLAFRPDLLLMWGEEMLRDFREYQATPSIRRCKRPKPRWWAARFTTITRATTTVSDSGAS